MKTDRRTIIKKSLHFTAAAYVAPVTLQLLTATHATAQSVDCGSCATVTITNNRARNVVEIDYTDCGGNSVNIQNATLIPPGGSLTLSAQIGTIMSIRMSGDDFPQNFAIVECDQDIVLN